MEDVVPQGQAHVVSGQKVLPDEQGVGDAPGHGLDGIADDHAQLAAVPQQGGKGALLPGGDDDEHLPDARLHEHGQGIVDEGFIVDGQKGLADGSGHGIQAGAPAGGQYDPFHGRHSFVDGQMDAWTDSLIPL